MNDESNTIAVQTMAVKKISLLKTLHRMQALATTTELPVAVKEIRALTIQAILMVSQAVTALLETMKARVKVAALVVTQTATVILTTMRARLAERVPVKTAAQTMVALLKVTAQAQMKEIPSAQARHCRNL